MKRKLSELSCPLQKESFAPLTPVKIKYIYWITDSLIAMISLHESAVTSFIKGSAERVREPLTVRSARATLQRWFSCKYT
ncbi:hypothetical protein [Sulfuracidifex metallicus]|uniref:hypothetical protein n=1 Tax=Sulfuracidifex metallicus TaxID=47303 RepID=UPI002274D770|nr:hypothetical protein [Sulfuracidifex metallicus]MCY0850771.1 hypothetical protein [Sulfuracidifex metallicus]